MISRRIGDTNYLVSYEDDGPPPDVRNPSPERVAELRAMRYTDYLLSPEWRYRRYVEVRAADRCCRRCRSRSVLHVHHLTYERLGCERPEDLEVLCADCHREKHGIAA